MSLVWEEGCDVYYVDQAGVERFVKNFSYRAVAQAWADECNALIEAAFRDIRRYIVRPC